MNGMLQFLSLLNGRRFASHAPRSTPGMTLASRRSHNGAPAIGYFSAQACNKARAPAAPIRLCERCNSLSVPFRITAARATAPLSATSFLYSFKVEHSILICWRSQAKASAPSQLMRLQLRSNSSLKWCGSFLQRLVLAHFAQAVIQAFVVLE